ncbi:RNA-guided pseudouridylation complex pseudouridine synthase subunit Cbf5 [archaeon]|nr:RNA-guided pseudouridylation complex pseudouridine synthase subunit Cbf5 [archaeon]
MSSNLRTNVPPWKVPKQLVWKDELHPDFVDLPYSLNELLRCGVIYIDKPKGPTSHEVSARVKRMLGITKASHFGTLDPIATGLLPIGIGVALKLTQAVHETGKEYVGILHLHATVSRNDIQTVFKKFVGDIYQRPPVRSSVARRVRIRRIYELELLEMDGKDVLFRVACESGTYIRKLAYDIGDVLGVGAHLVELRRTRVGGASEEGMVLLQELDLAAHLEESAREKVLLKILHPVNEILSPIPSIYVKVSAAISVAHGAPLAAPGVIAFTTNLEAGKTAVCYTMDQRPVAVMQSQVSAHQLLDMEKGIVALPKRVIPSIEELKSKLHTLP